MKRVEKEKARALRKRGVSLNEIVKAVGASKASVSFWVRDIELTKSQRAELTARGFSKDAVEKRRLARIAKTRARHNAILLSAQKEIQKLSRRDLWLIGTTLYWGEGGKTQHGSARISNSDPAVLQLMMRFFREILNVPEEKFRCGIHTFSHLNAKSAEEYWSHVTGIPLKQFYKTYSKPSIASRGKKDSLPFGTAQVYVCDTKIFLTIMGWIRGIAATNVQ